MSAVPSRARGIWTLGMLDLRLVASDRSSIFWMLAFPITLMWLFGTVFGSGGADQRPTVGIGVLMADQGVLGPLFLEGLEGEGVKVTPVAAAAADSVKQEMRVLTVPADFSTRILAKQEGPVRLSRESGGRTDFDRAAEIRIYKAIARLLGNLAILEKETHGSASALAPADLGARLGEIARRPDQVVVKSETAGRGRPVPSGFSQSVPGTLTMSILMMTVIYGAVFLTLERNTGMLRRQGSAPIRRRDLLAGKLFGRLLIALAQVILLYLAGRFLFHVDFGRSPAGLALLLVCYTAACAGIGLLFGALYRTAETAGATGWIGPLIMAAMGGCWWPLEVVPPWMRTAGHLFPTAWAMDGFHRLISFGEGVGAVWPIALILLGYAVVTTALAVRFLRWD